MYPLALATFFVGLGAGVGFGDVLKNTKTEKTSWHLDLRVWLRRRRFGLHALFSLEKKKVGAYARKICILGGIYPPEYTPGAYAPGVYWRGAKSLPPPSQTDQRRALHK